MKPLEYRNWIFLHILLFHQLLCSKQECSVKIPDIPEAQYRESALLMCQIPIDCPEKDTLDRIKWTQYNTDNYMIYNRALDTFDQSGNLVERAQGFVNKTTWEYHMNITHVYLEDDGLWECEYEMSPPQKQLVTLGVISKPVKDDFNITTSDGFLIRDRMNTLTCSINPVKPESTYVHFLVDSKTYTNASTDLVPGNHDSFIVTSQLNLWFGDKLDANVQCQLMEPGNEDGIWAQSEDMTLIIYYAPIEPPNLNHNQGPDVPINTISILSCNNPNTDEGRPSPDETHFFRDSEQINVDQTYNTFISLNHTDAQTTGSYTCQKSNIVGLGPVSEVKRIRVVTPAVIEYPLENLGYLPWYDDGNFNISCIVSGTDVEISWFKDGLSLPPNLFDRTDKTINGDFSFGQKEATESSLFWKKPGTDGICGDIDIHDGVYVCSVTNLVDGNVTESPTITVKTTYPPVQCNGAARYRGGEVNSAATLTCEVKALNNANYTWAFSGDSWPSNVTGENTNTLKFAVASADDFGQYECNVEDEFGVSSFSIQFKEQGRPDAPTDFQEVWNTSYSLTISFKAGWNGGYPQTFTVQYRQAGDTEYITHNRAIVDHSTDYKLETYIETISELVANQNYDIRLVGKNSNPESDKSESDPLYGSLSVPAKPNVTLEHVFWESNTVVVMSQVDNGQPSSYTVEYTELGDGYFNRTLYQHIPTNINVFVTNKATERNLDDYYRYRLAVYEKDYAGEQEFITISNIYDEFVRQPPETSSRPAVPTDGLSPGAAGGIGVAVGIVFAAIITGVILGVVMRRNKQNVTNNPSPPAQSEVNRTGYDYAYDGGRQIRAECDNQERDIENEDLESTYVAPKPTPSTSRQPTGDENVSLELDNRHGHKKTAPPTPAKPDIRELEKKVAKETQYKNLDGYQHGADATF